VCTQLQIGYGMMAATFPCLRPFVSVYEMPAQTHTNSYFQHGSRSDFKLTSVNSSASAQKSKSRNRSPDGGGGGGGGGNGRSWADMPAFRPDQSTHTATVAFYDKKNNNHHHHRKDSSGSIHSHDSQKMIIERKVDYSVTYDDRSLRDDGEARSSADGHV
jgi:hypothetical protein